MKRIGCSVMSWRHVLKVPRHSVDERVASAVCVCSRRHACTRGGAAPLIAMKRLGAAGPSSASLRWLLR